MTPTFLPTADSVTLRPVAGEDREFLVGLYGSTREDELALVAWPAGQHDAFLRMQFDAQDVSYRTQNPAGSFDVIEVDGRPVGRLYVDRRPGDIRIVDIALLPEFRGYGVGGLLITTLMDEAASSNCRLSIHVQIHNRAAELYTRMGFVVRGEGQVYNRMEWAAE